MESYLITFGEAIYNILFWYFKDLPYFYQIASYISKYTGRPMIEGIEPGDSLMNFTGVLLAASLVSLVVYLYGKISSLIIAGKFGYADCNPFTRLLLFNVNAMGQKATLNILFEGVIGFVLSVVANKTAGVITGVIASGFEKIFPNVLMEWKAFFLFVIVFVMFSIISGLLIQLRSGIGFKRFIPFVRSFIINILPDIVKLMGSNFMFVAGFMYFSEGEYLKAIIAAVSGTLWSFAVKFVMEAIEERVGEYYLFYGIPSTVSNGLGLVSEFMAILMFYQIMSVNMNTQVSEVEALSLNVGKGDILVNIMSYLPFLRNFVFQKSVITTSHSDLTGFLWELVELLIICTVFCTVRRLYNWIPIPNIASSIIEGVGWWFMTVLNFVLSVLVYAGVMILILKTPDQYKPIWFLVGVLVMLVIVACSPPLLQHIILIPFFVIVSTMIMEATGLGGSCGMVSGNTVVYDESRMIVFVFYTLLIFFLGIGFGVARAATKPMKLLIK